MDHTLYPGDVQRHTNAIGFGPGGVPVAGPQPPPGGGATWTWDPTQTGAVLRAAGDALANPQQLTRDASGAVVRARSWPSWTPWALAVGAVLVLSS